MAGAGLRGRSLRTLGRPQQPARRPEGNDPTPPGLSDLPAAGALAWQALRVIGYLLITPLAEELAFRGFLYRRLIAKDFEQVSAGRLALLPLLVWFSSGRRNGNPKCAGPRRGSFSSSHRPT